VRDRVPVNVVVPALPHEDLAGYVTDAVARTGATTFKVKVAEPGSALADDLARVATVRAALSEAGVRDPLLRLDANGAWTVAEARRAARMFLAEFGPVLDYLEQPCRTTTELAELRYRLVDDEVAVRIAVDEGLRRARDLYADGLAASLRSAGDVLIVKVAPVGGVARALGLIEDIGLPVVVSGEMNTSVGLCAGIALAAAVPDLAGAAGLGTGLLLGDDVVAGTAHPPRRAPGGDPPPARRGGAASGGRRPRRRAGAVVARAAGPVRPPALRGVMGCPARAATAAGPALRMECTDGPIAATAGRHSADDLHPPGRGTAAGRCIWSASTACQRPSSVPSVQVVRRSRGAIAMNPSTALARAILDELVHQGVHEIVLAPGSRSAPLAFEALRLARLGRLRLHVRIDERSAGFLALGLAKVSADPVAVVCTSGTAVANLMPAVVEASYAAVPLVVVTADRPVEARGVGAAQTIDQVGIFGAMVRTAADLGAPRRPDRDDPGGSVRAARASVAIAMAAALGAGPLGVGPAAHSRHAGPVHLNVGFRLPLVPDPAAEEAARPGGAVRPPRARRPPLDGCTSAPIDGLLGDVPSRGVLLVGDLPCSWLRGHHQWLDELAAACGWPIVAEPSANLHDAATALAHGVLVLGAEGFLEEHPPDLVVSAGLFGLSRPTMALLRAARRHVALDLPNVGREVCDPVRTAATVLRGIPLPPDEPVVDPAWLAAWQRADAIAARAVDAALAAGGPTGTAAVARLWSALPDDALLLVAASWPVRQLEAVGGRRGGVRVIGNRGANGIDGLVSTAWGAALAHRAGGGGPAVALLGDLAFLHDHNGLLAGPDEPRPDLVLVVASTTTAAASSTSSSRAVPSMPRTSSGSSAPGRAATSSRWRRRPGSRRAASPTPMPWPAPWPRRSAPGGCRCSSSTCPTGPARRRCSGGSARRWPPGSRPGREGPGHRSPWALQRLASVSCSVQPPVVPSHRARHRIADEGHRPPAAARPPVAADRGQVVVGSGPERPAVRLHVPQAAAVEHGQPGGPHGPGRPRRAVAALAVHEVGVLGVEPLDVRGELRGAHVHVARPGDVPALELPARADVDQPHALRLERGRTDVHLLAPEQLAQEPHAATSSSPVWRQCTPRGMDAGTGRQPGTRADTRTALRACSASRPGTP
jgi:2-succinyl-5-enolpyruvyl-6-hydroxy-3-cyclohexene-1-carboxylate synthase